MFGFLGTAEIVSLVEDFMHKWNQTDEQEEVRVKRLRREYEEKRKQLKLSLAQAADVEFDRNEQQRQDLQKRRKVQDEEPSLQAASRQEVRVDPAKAPTIRNISEGTGLSREQIEKGLKAAEDQFVHWPHPEQPGVARLALRAHAERFGLENWQPGVGF